MWQPDSWWWRPLSFAKFSSGRAFDKLGIVQEGSGTDFLKVSDLYWICLYDAEWWNTTLFQMKIVVQKWTFDIFSETKFRWSNAWLCSWNSVLFYLRQRSTQKDENGDIPPRDVWCRTGWTNNKNVHQTFQTSRLVWTLVSSTHQSLHT